jgi:hypothetical protein
MQQVGGLRAVHGFCTRLVLGCVRRLLDAVIVGSEWRGCSSRNWSPLVTVSTLRSRLEGPAKGENFRRSELMVSHRLAGLDREYARIGLIRAELGSGFSGNATGDAESENGRPEAWSR